MNNEIEKHELIKIKCPLCKAEIPSNAVRCSHCSGDLNTTEVQADIQEQLRVKTWATKVTAGLFLFIGVLITFFVFTGDGEENKLGQPEVYERISAMTDCTALQAGFDRAAEHGDRNREIGNYELARVSTAYMGAYDDRMREVGCY